MIGIQERSSVARKDIKWVFIIDFCQSEILGLGTRSRFRFYLSGGDHEGIWKVSMVFYVGHGFGGPGAGVWCEDYGCEGEMEKNPWGPAETGFHNDHAWKQKRKT